MNAPKVAAVGNVSYRDATPAHQEQAQKSERKGKVAHPLKLSMGGFSHRVGSESIFQKIGSAAPRDQVINIDRSSVTEDAREFVFNELYAKRDSLPIYPVTLNKGQRITSIKRLESEQQIEQPESGRQIKILQGKFGSKANKAAALIIYGSVNVLSPRAWRMAFNEQKNIDTLKRLGILVHEGGELRKIRMADSVWLALVMEPHPKNNFEIHDVLYWQNNKETDFDWRSIKDNHQMVQASVGIIKDIATLVKNKIYPRLGSVNLAIKDGSPRLFIDRVWSFSSTAKKKTQKEIVGELIEGAIDAFSILSLQARHKKAGEAAINSQSSEFKYMDSIQSNGKNRGELKEMMLKKIRPALASQLLFLQPV